MYATETELRRVVLTPDELVALRVSSTVAYLHVQEDVTPAAVNPVPSDRFATEQHKLHLIIELSRTSKLFAVVNITTLLQCGSNQDHANGEQSAKANDYSIPSSLTSE